MPTSPRRNDWSSNSVFCSTYPPTPPAQLPTPLPEERLPYTCPAIDRSLTTEESENDTSDPQLIDFDTPTPPQLPLSLHPENVEFVDEDGMGVSRTPPFKEAQLPNDSPPPLPVRPRVSCQRPSNVILDDLRRDDGRSLSGDMPSIGRRRPPNLSRPTAPTPISPTFSNPGTSSTLENFTRTIRGYVPSISSGSSPTVPRPSGFFGNSPAPAPFRPSSRDHRGTVNQQEFERDYKLHEGGEIQYSDFDDRHRPEHTSQDTPTAPYAHARDGRSTLEGGASGLAQAMERSGTAQPLSPSDQAEAILWARWDSLHERKFLFLGYASGLQIWDCTRLSSVDEVLNLNLDSDRWKMFFGRGDQGTHVVHAAVLPLPSHQTDIQAPNGPWMKYHPLIGILLEGGSEGTREQDLESIFLVYSVRQKHEVVKSLSFSGSPSTFVANEHFIVICTTNPATLYILSSTTFQTLHTISSTSFELFAPQVFLSNLESKSDSKPVSLFPPSFDGPNVISTSQKSPRRPIFALSHRLLAYASPMPPSQGVELGKKDRRLSSSSSTSGPSGSSVSSSPFGFGLAGLGRITQTDVGHAALKVSETVFSGMKYLGGIALEAAKSRVIPGSSSGILIARVAQDSGDLLDEGRGRFVSRSAPDHRSVDEAAPKPRERRYSSSTSPDDSQLHSTAVMPLTKPAVGTRYYVTVVDLLPLLQPRKDGQPVKINEFVASHTQPVAKIEFSADGTCIGVVLRHGHSLKIFKLQPFPRAPMSSLFLRSEGEDGSGGETWKTEPTLIYNLRRGITSGIVDSIEWAKDGRYVGIGTRHGTVHIYAVNPCGGKPDVRSHLEERVRNLETMEVPMTNLIPIARLKGSKTLPPAHSRAALAFTFISTAELTQSPGLLPPVSPIPITYSPILSPASGKRGSNYQHILHFDPEDGVLSLHRLTLEKQLTQPVMASVAASAQLAVTSISIPGMGGAGKLSSSPAANLSHTGKIIESEMELAAKVHLVATYYLRRGLNWTSVLKPMAVYEVQKSINSANRDFLAEAELSTCSNSERVLPRSVYLSHQFTFHTLGEDYHALIRSYQFHVPGSKVEVRKEVELSAYSTRNNATFVDGFPSRDVIHGPSSIDEPIASAISGSLENSNIPLILPMYPNGIPGSSTKSLRNSIPIRAMSGIGEGVSESFGRIRREMHRVRSPHLSARSAYGAHDSVPLEFDEEDEDFLSGEIKGFSPTVSDTLRDGNSTSFVPVAVTKLLEANVVGTVDEEMFDGWDMEDKRAIEEAEAFAHLSAAGFVEEEYHTTSAYPKVR